MEILEQNLGRVEAPAELWDRVTRGRETKRSRMWPRWALAAACASVAMAGIFYRPAVQSNDPALIREWVKARTGMDVPLAGQHAIQLTGARVVKTGKIEIAYRSGVVLVSKAEGAGAHWGSYAVACEKTACVLCHS
jgi:hypothetical protein